MLRKKITTLYSAAGKEVTDDMKMEELVKPSIFDTDEIKETKVFIVEIQEYIDEIAFLEANKEALKKEQEAKELAKKADPNNPDGFGKPQANADQFRTTGFTLKKKSAPFMNSELRKAVFSRNMARTNFHLYGRSCWEAFRQKRNLLTSCKKK